MAFICVRAEGEHERILRQSGNLYVLEPVMVKALESGTFFWIPLLDPYGDTVLNRLQIPLFEAYRDHGRAVNVSQATAACS